MPFKGLVVAHFDKQLRRQCVLIVAICMKLSIYTCSLHLNLYIHVRICVFIRGADHHRSDAFN